jgi:hypothetical protein
MADNELGRMLRVDELAVGTVVVLGREDRPYLCTVWVTNICSEYVLFGAGEIRLTIMAFRHPDGRLTDDTGARLLVFEYLGEV